MTFLGCTQRIFVLLSETTVSAVGLACNRDFTGQFRVGVGNSVLLYSSGIKLGFPMV